MTHVLAATDANGACSRTLKVLMAILNGKWVLKMDCKLFSFFYINYVVSNISRDLLNETKLETGIDLLKNFSSYFRFTEIEAYKLG